MLQQPHAKALHPTRGPGKTLRCQPCHQETQQQTPRHQCPQANKTTSNNKACRQTSNHPLQDTRAPNHPRRHARLHQETPEQVYQNAHTWGDGRYLPNQWLRVHLIQGGAPGLPLRWLHIHPQAFIWERDQHSTLQWLQVHPTAYIRGGALSSPYQWLQVHHIWGGGCSSPHQW